MRNPAFALFVVLLTLVLGSVPSAACIPRVPDYFGDVVPNNGCGNFALYAGVRLGEYVRTPVLEGGSYTISTCGASVDTQLTGFQGNITDTAFFYNDDHGPDCPTTTQASKTFAPDFTDYLRTAAQQYNCLPWDEARPVVTLKIRQNDNLAFTSPDTEMCSGQTRILEATPEPVTSTPQPNSGNPGTFSGTGVVGGVFTAPDVAVPTDFTVFYDFGFCGTSQTITVRPPSIPTVGEDQEFCGTTSYVLGGSAPPFGTTGTWTGPPGVTFSPNASFPGARAFDLPEGTSELTWTHGGECGGSATIRVTSHSVPEVSVGDSQTFCGPSSAPLGAGPVSGDAVGTWSGPEGVEFLPSPNDPSAIATGVPVGGIQIVWEVVDGICTNSLGLSLVRRPDHFTVRNADADGYESVRDAVDRTCPAGTVEFDSSLAGTTVPVGAVGELLVSRSMTIDGSNLDPPLTLDGEGASRLLSIDAGTSVTLRGLRLRGGSSSDDGGALHVRGDLTLDQVEVEGNVTTSAGRGGAAFVDAGGSLAVRRSTMSGNSTAGLGDGGAIFVAGGGHLEVANSTLSGNRSGPSGLGGGIYSAGDSAFLFDSTVTGNEAPVAGGGLYLESGLGIVSNSILAGNTAGLAAPDVYGAIGISGDNLVGDGSDSSGWSPTDLVGTEAMPVDPRLAPLAYRDGRTATHWPRAGSPALDGGSCRSGTVIEDQRGVHRPVDRPDVPDADDGCDIGSVELEALFFDGFETGDVSVWD